MNHSERDPGGKRIAMLIALPIGVWNRIRDEAREVGVGPSKLIEPLLLRAFGDDDEADR
ncbi:MAG TPA: hypothetical protein VGI19_09255 [Candidatus Cybelea sp.]